MWWSCSECEEQYVFVESHGRVQIGLESRGDTFIVWHVIFRVSFLDLWVSKLTRPLAVQLACVWKLGQRSAKQYVLRRELSRSCWGWTRCSGVPWWGRSGTTACPASASFQNGLAFWLTCSIIGFCKGNLTVCTVKRCYTIHLLTQAYATNQSTLRSNLTTPTCDCST